MPPASQTIFIDKLRASWPPADWADRTALVAVSGGADSVALARGLAELRQAGEGRLILAHFNHRLRGDESDADEAFVTSLAQELKWPIAVARAEAPGQLSSEAAAREARYEFLTSAAAQWGARYIATAHTADDQVETVLHNILRGTGLAGLAGIPRTRVASESVTIIRPLLAVTREEVLAYLHSLGQSFREDSTNQQGDYTRNRIRHHLLPLLERDYNPNVREALQRLASIAAQASEFIAGQADELARHAVRFSPEQVEISLTKIAAPPVVWRQALLHIWQQRGWPLADMSLEKWDQLLALLTGDAGQSAIMLPGGIRATRAEHVLRLGRT